MAAIVMEEKNYKGLLINFCLKNAKPSPIFETPAQTGPPHNPVFTCKVFIGDQMVGTAEDGTKKSAENKAAKMALEALENRKIVYQPEYVALLNEFCQKKNCLYKFVEVCCNGPAHDLQFICSAKVGERMFPNSRIKKSKKQAKKEAAYLALKGLRIEFPDDILDLPEAFIDESGSESSSMSGSAGSISFDRGNENGFANSTPADSETCQPNYIALLLHVCQKQKWVCNYLEVQHTGASHIPQFTYRVNIADRNFPESKERSTKKVAKKEAAFLALRELRGELPGIIPELPNDFIDDSSSRLSLLPSSGGIGLNTQPTESGLASSATTDTAQVSSNSSCLSLTQPESSLSAFIDITQLDAGAFGKVLKAQKILDEKYYAVKIIHLRDKKYVQEVKALARLEHKNIVRYFNAWWGQDCFSDSSESGGSLSDVSGKFKTCLFIQMELCEEGSLKRWIERRNASRSVDKNTSLEIFRQILEGVKYMHDQQFIHRDLKPANILFTKDFIVKIGDFGLVTQMTGEHETQALQRTQGTGTPPYMAPEQKEDMYENEVDIFALGLILVELLWIFGTGHERATEWKKLRKGELPRQFEEKYPIEEYEIKKILSTDPKKRPSAAELIIAFQANTNINAKTR
ncbi:interferon-induced, double-stranded RNA-activated protein kinase-like [Mixophyes fleayi]|uniref:interferon-induced, double-stranded RNA-activated protein kinase-like n=1 Tax=Mixophyes fleayi TaxID=3061075 RepID=UPI003F4DB39B